MVKLIKSLKTLPPSQDEWVALRLFPFKAWVLISFPFYLFFSSYSEIHRVQHAATELGEFVIGGYMLSILVLLFGALVQSIVWRRGAAARTILYVVGSICLVRMVYNF